MKFIKKKGVIPALIVTGAVAISIFIVHFTGSNPVANGIHTIFAPFQSGTAFITSKVRGFTSFLWEAQSYKEQNEKLEQELTEVKMSSMDAAKYREENERLRALLDLKNSMEDCETVAASVIAYSANNWYDTIEINKGTADGVEIGASVLCGDGVVGRVVNTGRSWATVSSIINTGSATGIRVSRTGDIGVVEGDGELSMKGLCRVSFIENDSSLIEGDILETSGSGGIYPQGHAVGRVVEVHSDTTGHLSDAYVEPMVDFSRLREVLVVK